MLGKKTVSILAILLLLAASGGAKADDWPKFRHDLRNTGYTDSPVPSFPNLIWKVNLELSSSPSVIGNRVYVVGAGAGTVEEYIYAIDAENGYEIWKSQVEGVGMWVSSPAVYEGLLYVGGGDSYVHAISADNGEEVWRFETGGWVRSSPAVDNGIVYIGSADNFFYALDSDNGSLIWKFETGDDVWSSPAVDNGIVYISSGDGYVYALNAQTGDMFWSRKIGYYLGSSPAIAYGRVYVGAYGYSATEGEVYSLNAENGEIIWVYQTKDDVEQSVAVVGNVVYGASQGGDIFALDAENGAEMWKYDTNVWIDFNSMVVADNKLYLDVWGNGRLYAFDAENGILLWTSGYPGTTLYTPSTPAIANGKIYYSGGAIQCLGTPPPTVESPTVENEISGTTTLWGIARGKRVHKVEINLGNGWIDAVMDNFENSEFLENYREILGFRKIMVDNELIAWTRGGFENPEIYPHLWTYEWDTSGIPNGSYELRARILYSENAWLDNRPYGDDAVVAYIKDNYYSEENVVLLQVNNMPGEPGGSQAVVFAVAIILVLAITVLGSVIWLKRR